MHNKSQNSGFILLLTVLLLSLMTVIVTKIYYRSSGAIPFIYTSLKRDQAHLLAFSGVQLAMSVLASKDYAQEEYLKQVFPTINDWHKIELKKELDGIDGEINFCITCEQGKFNLNKLYDFEKHAFPEPKRQALVEIFAKTNLLKSDFLSELENFLKTKSGPLADISELLESPKLAELFKDQIYYAPSKEHRNKIFLTDLFTVIDTHTKANPLLLSNSVANLMGLNSYQDGAARQQSVAAVFKKLHDLQEKPKAGAPAKAPAIEEILSDLYGVPKISKLSPEILALFIADILPPMTFSVLVYSTVNLITCKIFAIIQSDNANGGTYFNVVRLYWI
ncbi:MAG TPA: hypothetical protein VJJ81_01500 [Candidatus Babeliales bacterium]|nr:hypothetical protein [Candidatus Babeliales bacterium]